MNIVDLGLVYDVEVEGEKRVRVSMTLKAPDCPAAASRVAPVWQ